MRAHCPTNVECISTRTFENWTLYPVLKWIDFPFSIQFCIYFFRHFAPSALLTHIPLCLIYQMPCSTWICEKCIFICRRFFFVCVSFVCCSATVDAHYSRNPRQLLCIHRKAHQLNRMQLLQNVQFLTCTLFLAYSILLLLFFFSILPEIE